MTTRMLILPVLALVAACACVAGPDEARFTAGSPPVEEAVRLVRMAPIDGDARADTRLGRSCLSTDWASNNGYLYFDVSRAWLRRHGEPPYRLELTVEYLDTGSDRIAVQYDAMGADVAANFREVAWSKGGTGQWRSRTVTLEQAEFRNAQHGLADFRIGCGPDGDEWVAGLILRVISAAQKAARVRPRPAPTLPPQRDRCLPLAGVRIVNTAPATVAEGMALARLRERLALVGAASSRVSTGPTLVLGRWRPSLGRRYPRTAELIARLRSEKERFRRRDGYVVCLERPAPNPTVCAVWLSEPGAAFAMADLQRNSLREGRAPILLLGRQDHVEAPALERRELYINIGYGLGRAGITVETWDIARWRQAIDDLALARYNAWSFYLWGDCELMHPSSVQNAALNRRVHETLREAIRYSHRRGMRVGMHFSPSMMPREIWDAHPEMRSKLEYAYPGAVCPSNAQARPLMEEVYGGEIDWFRECDFFSIWFYDVGGCFCDVCRKPEQQLASLLWQVKTFGRSVKRANPRAEYQVMTWAIWRYERMHRYSIREQFVRQVQRECTALGLRLSMADGALIDPDCTPLFGLMRRAGIPAASFLYQTNIETGQPFVLLLGRYFARHVPQALKAGADRVFLMRIEAGSKVADDLLAGEFLWQPDVQPARALMTVARTVTGDTAAAGHAWEALSRMNDFAWFGLVGGGATEAKGRAIARQAQAAVAASPGPLRRRLEWLAGAGEAYAILGVAAEARENEDQPALLAANSRFTEAMARTSLFRGQAVGAPYWQELFLKSLVRYFQNGFSSMAF
ncbi:MAG: hypothetical protein NT029_18280 [Armatimonadetes bacterium]|nr:hypothetical protein [Armatimonadota bacterium]